LRLGVALFPAAFAFGHGVFAFLDSGFVTVDRELVFARFERSFPYFCGL
jgi:hypothetical protein